jgi:hypothetical protein
MEERPTFWQVQPQRLSLLQPKQPHSNQSQAQPPYRVPWQDGPSEADRKIAARRAALFVDGKPPQFTGTTIY